jgi:ferrous iron transport protein B
MGFGCNAAGVIGCRIIDSPRERMIAVLTNSFVPCNGRFPALIAVSAAFFSVSGTFSALSSALIMTGFISLGVTATLLASWISIKNHFERHAILLYNGAAALQKAANRPCSTAVNTDRTLFVLGRAAAVAARPACIIWLLANISIGGSPIIAAVSGFLDPFGAFIGLDGVILLAFILGLPANEIIIQ